MTKPFIKRTAASAVFILAFVCFNLAQAARPDSAAAAALVTEFDVNGLKVLVKRRPSAPTVAAALFVRGFFLLFFLIGAGVGYGFFIKPAWKIAQARKDRKSVV